MKTIEKATLNDIEVIEEIYTQAREFMRKNGNPNQWKNYYPGKEEIVQDIEKNCLYKCVDNQKIVGVFYYDYGYKIDPSYLNIEGSWIGEDTYGVVHRVASIQKGVGRYMLEWAYSRHQHLRIDTHRDNIPMQKLLKKLGFHQCGIITLYDIHEERIAFEK